MSRAENLGHAVEGGKLRYTSVSQIQTFVRCHREWHFNKVAHLPGRPPSKGTTRGSEGHERLAHYLSTGQDVLHPLERLAVEQGLLPPPKEKILVEHPLHAIETHKIAAGETPIVGYIDLVDLRAGVRLVDHKFKKDLSRYGATEKDLVDPKTDAGIQMITYARWAKGSFARNLKEITLEHLSFQTEGRQIVKPTIAKISLDEVLEKWDTIASIVGEMRQAASIEDSFQVTANREACGAYGGCPYRDKCFDPMQRVLQGFRTKKENDMGLMKDAMKKNGAAVPPPVQVPAAGVGQAVSPPDAPAPVKTLAQPAAPQAVAAAPVEEAKTEKRTKAKAAAKGEAIEGTILYVNAMPIGVATSSLLPYVEQLEQYVLKQHQANLLDLRTAVDEVLGFGKWKAWLAGAIAEIAPPAGRFAVTLGGDERVDVVVDSLTAKLPAGSVIRGIR